MKDRISKVKEEEGFLDREHGAPKDKGIIRHLIMMAGPMMSILEDYQRRNRLEEQWKRAEGVSGLHQLDTAFKYSLYVVQF